MIELFDGMLLYHGSYTAIKDIDLAKKQLIPERLQDQFCFKTQDAINCLEFIRSECYGDINL